MQLFGEPGRQDTGGEILKTTWRDRMNIHAQHTNNIITLVQGWSSFDCEHCLNAVGLRIKLVYLPLGYRHRIHNGRDMHRFLSESQFIGLYSSCCLASVCKSCQLTCCNKYLITITFLLEVKMSSPPGSTGLEECLPSHTHPRHPWRTWTPFALCHCLSLRSDCRPFCLHYWRGVVNWIEYPLVLCLNSAVYPLRLPIWFAVSIMQWCSPYKIWQPYFATSLILVSSSFRTGYYAWKQHDQLLWFSCADPTTL